MEKFKKYLITYHYDGRRLDVSQEKVKISDEFYNNVVKPLRTIVVPYLQIMKDYKPTQLAKSINKEIKNMIGCEHFFTESSPIGQSMKTGILDGQYSDNVRISFKKL